MKVLLLDAYNLIYRAKSGFTKGEYYVVYNFFRGLRPLIEKFSPDKVYFVLEGVPEFRKTLNENYKSNRVNNDQSFHKQKAQIISIMKQCFPATSLRHPKLECDDTIATLVSVHHKKGDVKDFKHYLLAKPGRQEIFERNVNLIRLVDFSNNLEELEINEGSANWEELFDLFHEMGFTSMVKEKTWNKYVKTFNNLQKDR